MVSKRSSKVSPLQHMEWNCDNKHERYRLGMAKTICEDWANLLLNEKVAIKAGSYSNRLNDILLYNKFRVNGNKLVERAFALGTGAFVDTKEQTGKFSLTMWMQT